MTHFPSLRALFILIACLLALAAGQTQAIAPADDDLSPFVPGQVVVGLEPGASASGIGVASAFELRSSRDHVTVAVPPGHERQFIQTILRQPGVRYAELNYLAQPQVIPNDEKYPLQWDMPMIQAEEAWNDARGLGVTIAVLDTGIAFEDYGDFARDPELSHTTFVDPYDATKDDAHPNDDNGHGTHVTGTLAEDWNDGIGVAGIAPQASIMPVKVCQPSGCPGDAIAQGIDWAVDHGADIITISLGGPTLPHVERDALAYAELNKVIVVAASGNGNAFVGSATLDYPGRVDNVIAVGAVDVAGQLTNYSNYGKHEHGGGLVIVAPGGNIHADLNDDGEPDGILQNTYVSACDGGTPNYKKFKNCLLQGTSMATPHVTGVIALLLSKYPDLTPDEVKTVLACSARDLGAPGPDLRYGVGLVQAGIALRDNDFDHIPDCLEARAQLELTAGNALVVPGGRVTVPIDARAGAGAIGRYDLQVTVDTSVVKLISCTRQVSATCSIQTGSVARITSGDGTPIRGAFRLAEITLEAVDALGQSTIAVAASATATDDFDPPPQVTAHDGLVTVEDVPQTVTGDANCDGQVNTTDVTQVLGYALGINDAFCWKYGDINCSGAIEGGDALAMLDFLSGIDAALPSGCPVNG